MTNKELAVSKGLTPERIIAIEEVTSLLQTYLLRPEMFVDFMEVMKMIICSFSDFSKPLDVAPRNLKGAKLHSYLLKQLKSRKRVSVWEIDTNMDVCKALMFLKRIGKISFTKEYDYPHVGIKIN